MKRLAVVLAVAAASAQAQTRATLDARAAEAIVHGCATHALAKKQSEAIAVVDSGGHMVAAMRMDGNGSGIFDFSLAWNLNESFNVSLTASNLTNEASDRFVGEPGSLATDFERQHFMNGRIYGIGARYRFGK